MRKFAISQNAPLHQYYTATHDTQHGGCGITHVSKNAELFGLLHTFHYITDKLKNSITSPEFAFTEFYLGHHLASLVGFRRDNTTPHSETPSWFYKNTLDVIRYYQITKEELIEGKIGTIYKRICNGSTRSTTERSDNSIQFKQFFINIISKMFAHIKYYNIKKSTRFCNRIMYPKKKLNSNNRK